MNEVVYPDDMRMGQFETAFCLAPELSKRRTILNHQIGKKFQCHIALQFFVACEPHNSHPASSEDLDQRVTAKDFCPLANSRDVARITSPARSLFTLSKYTSLRYDGS